MTLKAVFRPAAQAEFDGAAQWYEDRQPGLGSRFVAEIERAWTSSTGNVAEVVAAETSRHFG
jgi:hypothetical protein